MSFGHTLLAADCIIEYKDNIVLLVCSWDYVIQ